MNHFHFENNFEVWVKYIAKQIGLFVANCIFVMKSKIFRLLVSLLILRKRSACTKRENCFSEAERGVDYDHSRPGVALFSKWICNLVDGTWHLGEVFNVKGYQHIVLIFRTYPEFLFFLKEFSHSWKQLPSLVFIRHIRYNI